MAALLGAMHGAAPFEIHGATSGNIRGAHLTTPDPPKSPFPFSLELQPGGFLQLGGPILMFFR